METDPPLQTDQTRTVYFDSYPVLKGRFTHITKKQTNKNMFRQKNLPVAQGALTVKFSGVSDTSHGPHNK